MNKGQIAPALKLLMIMNMPGWQPGGAKLDITIRHISLNFHETKLHEKTNRISRAGGNGAAI